MRKKFFHRSMLSSIRDALLDHDCKEEEILFVADWNFSSRPLSWEEFKKILLQYEKEGWTEKNFSSAIVLVGDGWWLESQFINPDNADENTKKWEYNFFPSKEHFPGECEWNVDCLVDPNFPEKNQIR